MKVDSGDDLLGRLSRGDVEAAEQLFAAYAPFLRAVVRCQLSIQLRGKLDSADVVQSVWVQVVRQLGQDGWQVKDENQLKALLATIARRRLITQTRKIDRTAPLGPQAGLEAMPDTRLHRASEIALANDLWEQMLDLCPPDHHPILTLRREGHSLDEIASRTGMHEGSVRRIIRRLSRDLALRAKPTEEAASP